MNIPGSIKNISGAIAEKGNQYREHVCLARREDGEYGD